MRTREDLKYLQQQSLDEKIERAKWTISRFILKTGNFYTAFSGGKDSTVLLDLVQECCKESMFNVSANPVFVDTGLEYPEIKEFAKQTGGVTVVRPKMNFLKVLQTYGYPLISKEVSCKIYYARKGSEWAIRQLNGLDYNNNGELRIFSKRLKKYKPLLDLPIQISNHCCSVMKKSPFKSFETNHKIKNHFLGTLASESSLRQQSWLRIGCTSFDAKGNGKCTPLATWTEQDILHYIKAKTLDYCKIYGDIVYTDSDGNEMLENPFNFNGALKCTGCDRTGCMFCAYGFHLEKGTTRFQRLKLTHPKQYEYMLGGGEWVQRDGKQWWQPNKNGLGFAKMFDMVNEVYGKDFYRYE